MSLETDHPELFHSATSKEHSGACGTGFVAALDGIPRNEISEKALAALQRLEHRGGRVLEQEDDGGWSEVSDGAGILFGITPKTVAPHLDENKHIPDGEPALAGVLFIPQNGNGSSVETNRRTVDEQLRKCGLQPLGFRLVPTNPDVLGRDARITAPNVAQFFFGQNGHARDKTLQRTLWDFEQSLLNSWGDGNGSNESPTLVSLGEYIVYKGRATSPQLVKFYTDLKNPPPAAIALFHRRYATNTHSTWANTQPVSGIGENGEDNAIAANRNEVMLLERRLMLADESTHILQPGASDSRDFAAFINYLVRRQGRSLEDALRCTVLPAWWERSDFTPAVREWFMRERHELGGLSAWGEGPKLAVATDGRKAVAVMDRMGYRPAFTFKTASGLLGVASEAGAIPMDFGELVSTRRLRGGDIVVADTVTHEFLLPQAVHQRLMQLEGANGRPSAARPKIFDLGEMLRHVENPDVLQPQHLIQYGWTREEMDYLDDWLKGDKEPRGAMGRDHAPAAVSLRHPRLERFAFQKLASCTNPANDPELEGGAIDTSMYLGHPEEKGYSAKAAVTTPLGLYHMETNKEAGAAKVVTLDCLLDFSGEEVCTDTRQGAMLIADRIDQLTSDAVEAVRKHGVSIVILTHRNIDGTKKLPLSSFLLTSAINEALVEHGLDADIIVESAGIRDRHDMMVHFLCGASAICPTTIFERARQLGIPAEDVERRLRDAIAKGMSLPGVTTMAGFRGSKLLEFIGFGSELMKYFPGFASKVGGIGLEEVYEDMMHRVREGQTARALPQWDEARKLPKSVTKMESPAQLLAITGDFQYYEELERLVKEQGVVQLWDLLDIKAVGPPIPLEEVIPEEEILRQEIYLADMSDGALGELAHRAFARFARKHGITSGSGEGGENKKRRTGGEWEGDMSRTREIASARFCATIEWAADAGVQRIRVKIHQGAKPNESADVPGTKNDEQMAENRGLIPWTRARSPVTNMDLFSIEDFSLLLTLLHEAHPDALIDIKIVSNGDNDMITLGLAKADPDEIVISGGEGGTGSASLQAIHCTGYPREYGLADGHRGLVSNGLEEEIALSVDGGLLLADDVLKPTCMGARGKGFGSAAMQAVGCLLLRKCNVADGCKPGIATRRRDLLDNFVSLGKRSAVNKELSDEEKIEEGVRRLENFFIKGLCHAIRMRCAELGAHSPRELLGRTEMLRQKKTGVPRLDKLDLGFLIERAAQPGDWSNRVRRKVERVKTTQLNERMMEEVSAALASGERHINLSYKAENFDQAIGVRLAGEKVRHPEMYDDKQFTLYVSGTPGHGCFAFLHKGMRGVLEGVGNDMFGASLVDGAIVVAKPAPDEKSEAVGDGGLGNAALYGARGGDAYIRRGVGERFAACNSGARVVQEGPTGKYFCHFFRRGTLVKLDGDTIGDSPFCGMTGGKVFVLGVKGDLERKITHDSVVFRRTLQPNEEEEIKTMLQRHAEETGSLRASIILSEWNLFRNQWTVVEADKQAASSAAGVKHQIYPYYHHEATETLAAADVARTNDTETAPFSV